jgi:putative transposase
VRARYVWRAACSKRSLTATTEADAVVRSQARSRRIDGAPKICWVFSRHGLSAQRNTVSRIMQERRIRAKIRPEVASHGSPDLVPRDFGADGPNRKWPCAITYIPTDEGLLYLSGVMDASSRSIVGWSMLDSLHASMAPDVLCMAVVRRNPPRGLEHHSDRDVQYACLECRDLLEAHSMLQSMSRASDC